MRRPNDAPRPESVEEVALWAGGEGLRSTELVHAPIFWVLLPLGALGFLIWGAVTDPDGDPWGLWFLWGGVVVWLLIAVGVLVVRLGIHRGLHAENQWIFDNGAAFSIHRTSVDHDDGEAGGWPTYIALDHRLAPARARWIREAFETWLRDSGLPPSGAAPIASETLFGRQAKGGYFFLHPPFSQTAGVTTAYQWMLIAEPPKEGDELLVVPVPVGKRFQRMRERARRTAARRKARTTSTEIARRMT